MLKDIVVVGASAGGIEALRVLVGALLADLSASIFIVLHTSPEASPTACASHAGQRRTAFAPPLIHFSAPQRRPMVRVSSA